RRCTSCRRASCPSCTGSATLEACWLCGALTCNSCIEDSLCPTCARPTRSPFEDDDGRRAWVLGGGHRLHVGTAATTLVGPDGTATELTDYDPESETGQRRRSLAALLSTRPDLGF